MCIYIGVRTVILHQIGFSNLYLSALKLYNRVTCRIAYYIIKPLRCYMELPVLILTINLELNSIILFIESRLDCIDN